MLIKSTKKVSYRSHSRIGPVPSLIIQGLFLKGLGFNLGDQVKIDYQLGKIVIIAFDTQTKNHIDG